MRPWRIAGSALTALTLVAGSVSMWSWLARRERSEHVVYDRPAAAITVDLAGGDVTIVAGPAGRVTVDRWLTWSYGRPEIRERWTGTTLAVHASCAAMRLPGCAVRYRIEAPADADVVVTTGDGAVAVQDLTGALRLTARTGPVRVTNATGTLRLDAGDGDIVGTGLRSPEVTASSGGGVDLRFTTAPRTVRVTAVDGDVAVVVPPADAYNLHASTRSGNRTVTVAQDPAAPRVLTVDTDNGDVRVGYSGP